MHVEENEERKYGSYYYSLFSFLFFLPPYSKSSEYKQSALTPEALLWCVMQCF